MLCYDDGFSLWRWRVNFVISFPYFVRLCRLCTCFIAVSDMAWYSHIACNTLITSERFVFPYTHVFRRQTKKFVYKIKHQFEKDFFRGITTSFSLCICLSWATNDETENSPKTDKLEQREQRNRWNLKNLRYSYYSVYKTFSTSKKKSIHSIVAVLLVTT